MLLSKLLRKPSLSKIVTNVQTLVKYDIDINNLSNKSISIGGEVWSKGPSVRGQIIDKALGNNLGYNFPVADKFEDGVLTSIKSMDLSSPTYQTSKGIYSAVKNNIDLLLNFKNGYVTTNS